MPEQLTQVLDLLFSSLAVAGPDKVPESLQIYQATVQWAAIILAALAGVYEARDRDLDYFGSLVIAFVVAVGGGTLRDVLLGRYPLFWVASPIYLVTIVIVASLGALILARGHAVTPVLSPLVTPVWRVLRSDTSPMWVILVDALGMGLWAYLGTAFALQAGAALVVAPVFGVMTAAFGGVIRDVFFAETPSIFKRGQLYATSALIGSVVYVILFSLGVSASIGFVICVVVTFAVRMAAVRFNILSV